MKGKDMKTRHPSELNKRHEWGSDLNGEEEFEPGLTDGVDSYPLFGCSA